MRVFCTISLISIKTFFFHLERLQLTVFYPLISYLFHIDINNELLF